MMKDSGNEFRSEAGDDDAEVIAEALQMLRDLDNTPLGEMGPLFYQHWFEQLKMATGDLLRILGHDPDV